MDRAQEARIVLRNELQASSFAALLLTIVKNSSSSLRMLATSPAIPCLFFCALSALAAAEASGDQASSGEWPRFRGPNGSGISEATTVPVEFTVADYNWRVALPGEGHSSPVVWGKHVYVTSVNAAAEGRRTVLCFHADDGKLLWSVDVPFDEHNLNKANNFASSTPVCDAQGVYVTWGSGQRSLVSGFSHDGKLLWERSWEGFTSDHGAAASPVAVDGRLILHTDSKDEGRSQVRALDTATGADIWQHERVTAEGEKHLTVYSTPLIMENGGRKVVALLSPNDGWLGLNVTNGEVVWRHRDAYKFRSVGSLVSGDGMLFASMGSGGAGKDSAALRFESGASEPQLAYSLGLGDGLSYVPTPIIYDGLLFLWGDQGGFLTCRELRTGEVVYEKQRIGGNYFSSPIIIDGRLYCGSKEGELVVVPATRDFEVLARNQFDSGIYATPAVAGGRLFVRTETHLISIGGGK